jgi:hypothetical protein
MAELEYVECLFRGCGEPASFAVLTRDQLGEDLPSCDDHLVDWLSGYDPGFVFRVEVL